MTHSIAIVGGGLSGLTLGVELLEAGLPSDELLILDGDDSRRGSDVPMALLHPFPGRSLKPAPGLKEAWEATRNFLASHGAKSKTVTPLSLLRPYTHARGARLHTSFEAHRDMLTRDFNVDHLSANVIKHRFPFLGQVDGAIEIASAQRVHLRALCETLRATLKTRGVQMERTRISTLSLRSKTWHLQSAARSYRAARVVLAPGASLGQFFPKLGCVPTLGNLALIHWPEGPPSTLALSMGGHLLPMGEDQWLLGATYHRPPHELPSPEETFSQLVKALQPWLPSLASAQRVRLWDGVRSVIEPSRQAVVGAIPTLAGCYVLSGFGSKGLLWAPLLARHLAGVLTSQEDRIPSLIQQPEQQGSQRWVPNPAHFTL